MTNQLMIYSDSDRCIKCYACQVACKQWHKTKAGTTSRRNVIEYTSGTFPDVQRVFYSKGCMHCEEPACAAVPRGLLPSVPRMVSSWSIETNASDAITATSLAPLAFRITTMAAWTSATCA